MRTLLYWLTRNLADVPESNDWLSDHERGLLAGLRFPKRRNDWLLGRWTAKLAICAYQSGKVPVLSSLEIRAAVDGAPEAYWDGEPGKVSLSISHSNDQGFCIVGPPNFSLGCDLERIEPREDQFIEDYFTPEEIALCQNAPDPKTLVTNLIWSAKESTLKALRQGLRRDTRSVLIRPNTWDREREGSWNTWTGHCLESSRTFCGWWRSRDGYIYTLASDQPTSCPEQLSHGVMG
jgi:4'-phosphopantetheinyl transferase